MLYVLALLLFSYVTSQPWYAVIALIGFLLMRLPDPVYEAHKRWEREQALKEQQEHYSQWA